MTGRSTSAMLTLASTGEGAWTRWGHTGACVPLALQASTARSTLMTVLHTPVVMEAPVLTKSMTFCVYVSLLLMGKHAKEKWIPVGQILVKMELHVHLMETIRNIPVPVLWAIKARGARWTLTSAPPPCPAGTVQHVSTPMAATHVNARKGLKDATVF